MPIKRYLNLFATIVILLNLSVIKPHADEQTQGRYETLLKLYNEFRSFVPPRQVGGISDYSDAAMALRHQQVKRYLDRLGAIDDRKWPVGQRVDYMVVLAEMRALEFRHRIVQPWKRDPAFYSVTNLGFGPKMAGSFDVPALPVSIEAAEVLVHKLKAVPKILVQARHNLTDARGDLARLAIQQKNIELILFDHLAKDSEKDHPELSRAARGAHRAVDEFLNWLGDIESGLPPHGGIGRENYAWYLRYVLLFPYTMEEMRSISAREYQRSLVFLKMEEHRNRDIPMIEPVSNRKDYDRQRLEADEHLLRFLSEEQIMTIPDYLVTDPEEGPYILPADRDPSLPGLFDEPIRRHFFFEAEHRDPRPLRAHNVPGHLLDSLMQERDKRPVRGQRRLFFVDGVRAEGWAFYLEELIQQTGLLKDRPKAREINYILQVMRAARILPELKMHANEWTYQQAFDYFVSRVPYWMGQDDAIARFDIELYLRQPGYGIGYYIGKVELEKLLADRAGQLGKAFDLKKFHDRFLAAGRIPISLIRWEMTGLDDEIRMMR